jgi:ABC-type Mn2+/Zn2+ transport system permease subunit
VFLAVSLGVVSLCSRVRRQAVAAPKAPRASPAHKPGVVALVAQELASLFVDDGWLAIGIVLWVLSAWIAQAHDVVADAAGCALFTAGLAIGLSASAIRRARA